MLKKKVRVLSFVGALALALVIGGISIFAGSSVASASEGTVDDLQALTQASTGPGLL